MWYHVGEILPIIQFEKTVRIHLFIEFIGKLYFKESKETMVLSFSAVASLSVLDSMSDIIIVIIIFNFKRLWFPSQDSYCSPSIYSCLSFVFSHMLQVRNTTNALIMLDRPSSRLERSHTTDAGGEILGQEHWQRYSMHWSYFNSLSMQAFHAQ